MKHADCMGMLKVKCRETGFVHSARKFLQRMAVNVFSSMGYILADLGDSFLVLQAKKKMFIKAIKKQRTVYYIWVAIGCYFVHFPPSLFINMVTFFNSSSYLHMLLHCRILCICVCTDVCA